MTSASLAGTSWYMGSWMDTSYSQFWNYNPPPKLAFPRPKYGKFLLSKTAVSADIKNSRPKCKWRFFFDNFFVTPFSTFANNKRSYQTNSSTLDHLRWRIGTACEDFPGVCPPLFCEHLQNENRVFIGTPIYSSALIYTTSKEAHSRIFVTGGSLFARQMVAKKIAESRGDELVSCTCSRIFVTTQNPNNKWKCCAN